MQELCQIKGTHVAYSENQNLRGVCATKVESLWLDDEDANATESLTRLQHRKLQAGAWTDAPKLRRGASGQSVPARQT